jgi:hypothetical protein
VLTLADRLADLAGEAMPGDAPKPLDDPRLQELFMSAITGAISMGAQGTNRPPVGHWLCAAWNMGAETARAAAPAPVAQCRDDGRCQYAIDHGAEGLAACPKGKCAMLPAPVAQGEPVAEAARRLIDAYRVKYAKPTNDGLRRDAPLYREMADLNAALAAPAPVLTPAQALTDGQIADLVREAGKSSALRRDGTYSVRIARAVERACAEAWGVKLVEATGREGGK